MRCMWKVQRRNLERNRLVVNTVVRWLIEGVSNVNMLEEVVDVDEIAPCGKLRVRNWLRMESYKMLKFKGVIGGLDRTRRSRKAVSCKLQE